MLKIDLSAAELLFFQNYFSKLKSGPSPFSSNDRRTAEVTTVFNTYTKLKANFE